jgi:hypothetical protein
MRTAMRLTTINFLTVFFLVGNPAQAGLLTCTSTTNYSLSDATQSECFSGNDTNQIDSGFSLFGMTGWTLSDKNDDSNGDGVINFITAPNNGNKSGTWAIDTLAGLDNVVITLKAGNGFGAFLLDLTTNDPLSGTWSSGKGLSHASIYYNGAPTKVPEPSTLALIGLGLLGFGIVRRRVHK